jgi:hypothetical protein
LVVYGEVETGARYCVVVSSAEGFTGVDCWVSVLPTIVLVLGGAFFKNLQEKETFSNNMYVRVGGCSHSADPKCITR